MKKLKLLDNLKKHGITPHASMKYDASDFQNVLKKEYGHHGFLKCTNVIGQSGVRLLEEFLPQSFSAIEAIINHICIQSAGNNSVELSVLNLFSCCAECAGD
ncbi:unnamed protein product [Schistosoma intercalatum]|nr:unnamed protein product [Schistosoma intercalatum]